jgi:hypothetical protein
MAFRSRNRLPLSPELGGKGVGGKGGVTGDTAKRADLLPHADTTDPVNAPDPAGTPTGMFAGETDQELRDQAATRDALEDALPEEPGSWKEAGAVPDHAPDATAASSEARRPKADRSSSG